MSFHSASSDDDAVVIDRDDISNYNPEHILPQSPSTINKIRKWLDPTKYAHESGEYCKHLASHMPGTGAWLTSNDLFRTWHNDREHGMLWIKGIPGSGKSVVAAHLVDLLKTSNPGVPVLYFFFRQIIDANHEPAALLRDWLDQVLEYSPPLQKELKELEDSRRSISSLSMDELWKFLRLAFTSLPSKVFCVADALDEMDVDNDEFLRGLAILGHWKPSKVKVLVTSRPVPSVESPFRLAHMLQVRLEEDKVDMDIASYVDRCLKSSNVPAEKHNMIRNAVPGRANGIFLYARLAMDAFLEPDAHIEEVVHTLPVDLHETYTRLLHEHRVRSGVPEDIQLLILQWITHATRPLRLLELAEMISVTYQSSETQNTKHDLRSTKDLVRAAAGPLLEILPNETICVIHHSFTEYLKCMTRSETDGGYPVLRAGPTNGRLALACLSYLQSGCLEGIKLIKSDETELDHDASSLSDLRDRGRIIGHDHESTEEEQRIRLQHPFFAYASANWHVHVARSCGAGFVQDDVNRALQQFFGNKQHKQAWLKTSWGKSELECVGVTDLHIAARYGLLEYACSLLADHADFSAGDIYGKTPLWWAATGGHAGIIQLLARSGADPDVDEKVGGLTPLHEAANENHAEAVRALLEAGVNPLTPKTRENPGNWCGNAPRSTGHTPLMYACHNGHLEALDAFLPFLVDVDTVHRALSWSAERGRSKLVKRILQHPKVDVNAKIRGNTPLCRACSTADHDSIVALLEAGADPTIVCSGMDDEFGGIGSRLYWHHENVKDETRGYTALHALCSNEDRGYTSADKADPGVLQELFSLLIQKGAKVDQRTSNGGTALHAAVSSPVLVRLLLNAGADPNAITDSGHVPLHRITSAECVGLLVEEGEADINKVDSTDGKSPLLCMLGQHHNEVILKLLEYRPDLTIKDKKGNGPLHIALTQWNTDTSIIKALFAAGADPNERNRAGETPLLVMRLDNRESSVMVDILLEFGADINAKDPKGMTVLTRAMGNHSRSNDSDHSDVEELLAKGADLRARDYKGKTMLHHAVSKHRGTSTSHMRFEKPVISRLDYMLSLGLDIKALDHNGNSLIHELALRSEIFNGYSGPQFITLWNQLISEGVNLEQGNYQGRTALHMLASTRPPDNSAYSFKSGHFGPIDLVLSKSTDVNRCDNLGLTALHLASTVSEFMVKKLLDAGADPSLATLEGLTALHLATRARQSNILGCLLAESRTRGKETVNAPDEKGNTPLYYACRSGRPESVRLLIDAGANVTDKSLFLACADFETEDMLWERERHAADVDINLAATGLTIDDKTRPTMTPSSSAYPNRSDLNGKTARLEDIIHMLIESGCDTSSVTRQKGHWSRWGALDKAANAFHTYTFDCLLRARDCNLEGPDTATTTMTLFTKQVLAAKKAAEVIAVSNFKPLTTGDTNDQWLITHLLRHRQYHVMRTLFEQGVNFLHTSNHSATSPLELFIEHGYGSLLKEIGSVEVERQLDKGIWHAFGDKTKAGLHSEPDFEAIEKYNHSHKPMLLRSLERALPNMEVVRLLIENFFVSVNQFRFSKTYVDQKYEMVQQDTALHYLAKGLHWWHMALAMPYLISKGADVNAKDHTGCTPLHIALGGLNGYIGPFHKEAARILVAAGADLNATNKEGKSCLASTAGDIGLVRLLVGNGATIHADSLFMTIEGKRPDVLQYLLSTGADPNMRLKPVQPSSTSSRGSHSRRFGIYSEQDISPHEVYPLYTAATKYQQGDHTRSPEENHIELQIWVNLVKLLIAAGADPYATFKRRNPEYHEEDDEGYDNLLDDVNLSLGSNKHALGDEYEDVTILHELLENNDLVHPILSLPKLDLNRQDSKGRTVMHAACRSDKGIAVPVDVAPGDSSSTSPSLLEYLLARGANPLATDNKGYNMLHHMFEGMDRRQSTERDITILTHVMSNYPSLINQATTYGATPLHLAVKHAATRCDIAPAEALLNAGADPSAVSLDGNGCLHTLAFRIYGSANVRTLFANLLNRGLDINLKNDRGEPPIFNLNKHIPFPHLLTAQNAEIIYTEAALSLFESAGADIFATDNEGRGLLHIAASETYESTHNDRYAGLWASPEGHKPAEPSIVRFETLMRKGLDPMMEDGQKRTALDVAAACGKESVLKLFEKEGVGAR